MEVSEDATDDIVRTNFLSDRAEAFIEALIGVSAAGAAFPAIAPPANDSPRLKSFLEEERIESIKSIAQ